LFVANSRHLVLARIKTPKNPYKISYKIPESAVSGTLLMSGFQKIYAPNQKKCPVIPRFLPESLSTNWSWTFGFKISTILIAISILVIKLSVRHVPLGLASVFAKDRATRHIHSTHSIKEGPNGFSVIHPSPLLCGEEHGT